MIYRLHYMQLCSGEGRVEENSLPGSLVLDTRGRPITFSVTDADLAQAAAAARPEYEFEITSDMFRLDGEGRLVVNTDTLDRDKPNQAELMVQVSGYLGRAKLDTRKNLEFLPMPLVLFRIARDVVISSLCTE